MKTPKQDAVFGAINRLMELTKNEDDRGLVLSMSAFAEDCLGRLLRAYMQQGKPANDLLEGFNAPLGTLSSRIKACSAFGLLSDAQYGDLELARKIRNEFAHNWEGCSLAKPAIGSMIGRMSESRISNTKAESPKSKFQQTMACTLVELEYLLSTLVKGQRRIPVVATHLSLTPPESGPRSRGGK